MTPYHVNHYKKFKNQQQCCINGLDCCNVLWQNSILKETKASTRIYIFLGKKKELQEFMTQMKVEQLFSKGKYMVIYISPDTLIPVEMSQFLWDLDTPSQIRNCEN